MVTFCHHYICWVYFDVKTPGADPSAGVRDARAGAGGAAQLRPVPAGAGDASSLVGAGVALMPSPPEALLSFNSFFFQLGFLLLGSCCLAPSLHLCQDNM